MIRSLVLSLFAFRCVFGLNVILSNDDGWATSQIRAEKAALDAAGFATVLSAPAENQSGTGSFDSPPKPLTSPCQFDTCPTGSPAEGFNASDPTLNYVNSYPVTSVKFGIQTLAPQFFGGKPDLVVSGPNIGNNLGLAVLGSGTVGAACEAAKEGIPAIAFSGASGTSVSYTTLQPNSTQTIYAAVSTRFLKALTASPAPFLPSKTILNVNLPATDSCTNPAAYQFVLTRVFPGLLPVDVKTCGSSRLPTESSILSRTSGCLASVSILDAELKIDVGADTQAVVLQRLQSILTCP
ncbi:hypothetical protein M422DRAFT_218066 [Sphaerobolus stellatus SS14]|nr:hypothetical protein M422DRAFT_218066 [Sphaerobolus stellatus SS14]